MSMSLSEVIDRSRAVTKAAGVPDYGADPFYDRQYEKVGPLGVQAHLFDDLPLEEQKKRYEELERLTAEKQKEIDEAWNNFVRSHPDRMVKATLDPTEAIKNLIDGVGSGINELLNSISGNGFLIVAIGGVAYLFLKR